MAAAIGSGLAVQEPRGNMIVDIGGRHNRRLQSFRSEASFRTNPFASQATKWTKPSLSMSGRTYNLLIGERTAEEIKKVIGSAVDDGEEPRSLEVRGRDLVTGLPKTIEVTSEEVRKCLADPIAAIVEAVKRTLERTPPELAADIFDRGIVMAGGGSLLRGLDRLLAEETGMPIHLSEDPLTAVAMGTGIALEHFELMQRVLISQKRLSG